MYAPMNHAHIPGFPNRMPKVDWQTYSNWEGDTIDQNSTSGYVFMFGGGPIFWSIKKQAAIALYSTKVEYRGAVNACIQAGWLQGILEEFNIGSTTSIVIFCEN